MDKSRALVVSEIFPPQVGGSGNWLHDLYTRQPAHLTAILAGEYEGDSAFDADFALTIERANLHGEQWTLMNFTGLRYFLALYHKIDCAAQRHGVVQLHCARVMPEGVAALAVAIRRGLQLVCFVHGEDIELARRSRESRWLVQKVISRCDRLVCNSVNTRALLENHWSVCPSVIRVLTPGIDTEQILPIEDPRQGRRKLGWEDAPTLLTVSRLEARKGHDVLIEALPEILKKVPGLQYFVIGDGEMRSTLEARVAELDLSKTVRFLGKLANAELHIALQCCDIFVLPNRQIGSSVEGFGIVLLEAQAAGRPVVAGNSGGTAETMIDGETGIIVNCELPQNIVEPLVSLLLDPARRATMGQAARKLMCSRFDWKVLSSKAREAVFM